MVWRSVTGTPPASAETVGRMTAKRHASLGWAGRGLTRSGAPNARERRRLVDPAVAADLVRAGGPLRRPSGPHLLGSPPRSRPEPARRGRPTRTRHRRPSTQASFPPTTSRPPDPRARAGAQANPPATSAAPTTVAPAWAQGRRWSTGLRSQPRAARPVQRAGRGEAPSGFKPEGCGAERRTVLCGGAGESDHLPAAGSPKGRAGEATRMVSLAALDGPALAPDRNSEHAELPDASLRVRAC
jgi:hypothetical protein